MGVLKKSVQILLILVLFTGCTKQEVQNNVKDLEINNGKAINIYISANGDLLYGKASISTEGIEIENVESLGIRKKRDVISQIEKDDDDQIYCTIRKSNGNSDGNEVYIVEHNKIKDVIELEKYFGPNIIMNSDESEMFVVGAVRPASYNQNGVSLLSIDEEDHEITDEFYVKGIIGAYATYDNFTTMIVCEAEKVGYTGFNNSYMVRVDNKSKETEMVNDNLQAITPRDMAITKEGIMYVINTPMFTEKEEVSTLYKYDLEGQEIGQYKLDDWADKIVIRDTGIAYITHRGKEEVYDDLGEHITIFDTTKDEVVGNIKVGKGPSDMYIYENFLLVSNYTDSTISVIDMDNNNVIGEIEINDIYKIDQIIITDN